MTSDFNTHVAKYGQWLRHTHTSTCTEYVSSHTSLHVLIEAISDTLLPVCHTPARYDL